MKRTHDNPFGDSGFLLGAKFSQGGHFMFLGGAGKNEMKVFMNNSDSSQTFKCVFHIGPMSEPIVAFDVSKSENRFVVALANGQIFSIKYEINDMSVEWEPYGGNFEAVAAEIIKNEETVAAEKKRVIMEATKGIFGSGI